MSVVAWFREGDRWIPSLFVGGFLVVLAVNSTMIWVALSTFGGLATTDYYDRGRTYNETLAAAETMAALGWQTKVATTRRDDGTYLVTAHVFDTEGAAMQNADVSGFLVRPSSADEDFQAVLAPQGDGVWSFELEPGLWQLRLLIERDGDQLAAGHRLELMP